MNTSFQAGGTHLRDTNMLLNKVTPKHPTQHSVSSQVLPRLLKALRQPPNILHPMHPPLLLVHQRNRDLTVRRQQQLPINNRLGPRAKDARKHKIRAGGAVDEPHLEMMLVRSLAGRNV